MNKGLVVVTSGVDIRRDGALRASSGCVPISFFKSTNTGS